MAARTNKIRHDEETRAKIQVSQIINRLESHIFGDVELTPAQVRSAEILLKKRLPDLSQTDSVSEVVHRYVARLPDATKSTEEWQSQHAPTIQ